MPEKMKEISMLIRSLGWLKKMQPLLTLLFSFHFRRQSLRRRFQKGADKKQIRGSNQRIGIDEVSYLCSVCFKNFKYGAINHGSMIFYIHEEVPSDNFFDKGLLIVTRTYRCCSLVKDTGERSRGYFCNYP
jgi:uncharacterized membrane protein